MSSLTFARSYSTRNQMRQDRKEARCTIATPKQCPFCNPSGISTRVIKRSRNVLVLLSDPRIMPGHLLVVPKRHVEKLSELTRRERHDILDSVIDFQERLLSRFAPDCGLTQHYRPFQREDGLKVNHLHIHLEPRRYHDKLYRKCQIFEKPLFRRPSNKEVNKLCRMLRD